MSSPGGDPAALALAVILGDDELARGALPYPAHLLVSGIEGIVGD